MVSKSGLKGLGGRWIGIIILILACALRIIVSTEQRWCNYSQIRYCYLLKRYS